MCSAVWATAAVDHDSAEVSTGKCRTVSDISSTTGSSSRTSAAAMATVSKHNLSRVVSCWLRFASMSAFVSVLSLFFLQCFDTVGSRASGS